jgi:hypothetical protein
LKTIVLNFTGNSWFVDQSNTKLLTLAQQHLQISIGLLGMKIISKGGRIIVYYRTLVLMDNNGVADELETIRKNGWLINEANLVFHVDGDAKQV